MGRRHLRGGRGSPCWAASVRPRALRSRLSPLLLSSPPLSSCPLSSSSVLLSSPPFSPPPPLLPFSLAWASPFCSSPAGLLLLALVPRLSSLSPSVPSLPLGSLPLLPGAVDGGAAANANVLAPRLRGASEEGLQKVCVCGRPPSSVGRALAESDPHVVTMGGSNPTSAQATAAGHQNS